MDSLCNVEKLDACLTSLLFFLLFFSSKLLLLVVVVTGCSEMLAASSIYTAFRDCQVCCQKKTILHCSLDSDSTSYKHSVNVPLSLSLLLLPYEIQHLA